MYIFYLCVRLVLLYFVIFLLRTPFPQRPISSGFHYLGKGSFLVRKIKLGRRVFRRRRGKPCLALVSLL
jgi:hypothetical protein